MLKEFGVQEVLRSFGGYNRHVEHVRFMNGKEAIRKTLPERSGRPLEEIMRLTQNYQAGLVEAGVSVVPISALFIDGSDGLQKLVEIQPVFGATAENIMADSSTDALPPILKTFLTDIVKPLFLSTGNCELGIGLDIGPRNGLSNGKGGFSHCDLVPPKIRLEGGKVTLEYPEPTDPVVYSIGEARHFDKAGLMLQLLTQLCKKHPSRRPIFQECLGEFLIEIGEKDVAETIQRTYTKQQIEDLVCIGEGYLRLRDAACQVAHSDRFNSRTAQRLNYLFVLLHMQDQPVPTEYVEQFKTEVLHWMDETEGG